MSAAPLTFQNPILSGFHPDPSLVRVGEDYYLVNSTFEYFPGLPIYHSKDLVHWRQIGNVLDRPSQNPLKGATDFGGQYAPTIRHHQGRFYVTCTNMTNKGAFIVTATDPAGPWSEPAWLGLHEMDGSMFFDDDGKAYYTKFAGKDGGGDGGEHSGISQAEFDPETLKVTTPFKMVYNNLKETWNEGPHLYKIKGWYYLMLAEGGTGDMHQEVIGRSKSPWGPFEPCPHNPILTHRGFRESPIQATGHADLFEAHDGSWWMVFLAVRPQKGVSVLGRETFLAPVEWKDGWPVVNKDGRVALTMEAPKLKPHPWPALPARQDFDGKALGPEWIHVRNIDPASFSLAARPGFLRLQAVKDGLSSQHETPAFAGQRQTAFRFTASTRMEFSPSQDGEEAGLIVRSNVHNHYGVGVEQAGGSAQVFVRNTTKGSTVTLVQAPFKGGAIHLQLSGDEEQYQFAWSADGKDWKRLGASPSADLSKEKAGGFTGTAIGLYATANGKASKAYADFDWFEMEDGKAPAPQAVLARPTQTPVPQRSEWRIAAGREASAGIEGNLWLPDQAFDGGQVAQTGEKIPGTAEAYLFQSERWEREFSYSLPVPKGRYRLRLLFAEAYLDNVGQRIFSVLVNGEPRIEKLDILAEAGGKFRPLVKELGGIEPGPDGRVKVTFKAEVQNAKVCALELLPEKTDEARYVKDMDGKPYFPLGVNYAWQDWGVDFADQGWEQRSKKITASLDLMQARGVRTVRWWVYTDFVASPLWAGEGAERRCTGMPQGWVKNFMQVADLAHARGMRLYPTFSSFDLGRKGFKEVVANPAVRKSFIEHAVRPLLKAGGKHPGIFAWDIINEPEWLVRREDGGDPNKELSHGPVSLAELRAYIADMAQEVKKSAKQPVSVGSAGIKWLGWQYDFYSGLGLDFFDAHYYDWMTPWFDITTVPKSKLAEKHPEYGAKPMIIGETIPQPETQYTGKDKPKDHTRFLKDIIAMGYTGYLPWAWNEKPELDCSKAIEPHFNRALKELKLPGQVLP